MGYRLRHRVKMSLLLLGSGGGLLLGAAGGCPAPTTANIVGGLLASIANEFIRNSINSALGLSTMGNF